MLMVDLRVGVHGDEHVRHGLEHLEGAQLEEAVDDSAVEGLFGRVLPACYNNGGVLR